MEENKNQEMELTTEVETGSTDEVSDDGNFTIINFGPEEESDESGNSVGKIVAGVTGIGILTGLGIFLYKKLKKKKAEEQDEENYEDETDNECDENDIVDVDATEEDQESDEQPEKDDKKPKKK